MRKKNPGNQTNDLISGNMMILPCVLCKDWAHVDYAFDFAQGFQGGVVNLVVHVDQVVGKVVAALVYDAGYVHLGLSQNGSEL